MLPDVGAQPGTAQVPVGPGGVSAAFSHGAGHGPDVAVVGLAPALLHPVIVPGGLCAVPGKVVQKAQQGSMHLRQGGAFRRPVVLFQVDVGGIVAAPRRGEALVPQALQVGRDPFRAGTGDEQVSAILEIQGFQFRIGFSLGIAQQLPVRGERADAVRRGAQVQLHAVKKGLVVLCVGVFELAPAFGGGLLRQAQ